MTFGVRIDPKQWGPRKVGVLTHTQRSLSAATVRTGRVVSGDTGVQHGPACEACATFASRCLCRPYGVQS